MTENEFSQDGIFKVPYYDIFRVDAYRNVYVIDHNEITRKIPYTEIKFMHHGKAYYPIELYCLTFYGIRNPFIYEKIDLETSEYFIINGMVFKKIIGLPEKLHNLYGINANGVVYSNFHHKIRKREIDEDGYVRISWSQQEGLTHMAIHRLVYQTWIGEIPDGMVIDHKDNNKWNNCIDNLQLSTLLENSRKAANDGLYQSYIHLNEDDIHFICNLLSKGYARSIIINKLGIEREKDPKAYKILMDKINGFLKYKTKPSTYSNIGWKDILDMYDFK